MTLEQGLLAAVSLSWSTWLTSFAIGKYRIGQLERRMDQAGEKMSDLANDVQTMPDKMRAEFVSRKEWEATERRRS